MLQMMAGKFSEHTPRDAVVDAVVLAANTDVRRITRFLLETCGVRATITDSGPMAARAMRCGVPQALIVDRGVLRLPGIAKLSEITRQHGALRVAVVNEPFHEDVARPAGADVLLSWPLVRRDVLGCLPEESAYWRRRRPLHG